MTVARMPAHSPDTAAADNDTSSGFSVAFWVEAQFLAKLFRQQAFGDVQYVRVQALRRRGIPSWGVFPR